MRLPLSHSPVVDLWAGLTIGRRGSIIVGSQIAAGCRTPRPTYTGRSKGIPRDSSRITGTANRMPYTTQDTNKHEDQGTLLRPLSTSSRMTMLLVIFFAYSLLFGVGILLAGPVTEGGTEVAEPFVVIEDGVTYHYEEASYAVKKLPIYGQWSVFVKERPNSIVVMDEKSIVTCLCCAMLIDVTNDVVWRVVKDHRIAVGCKIKLRREERIAGADREWTRFWKPQLAIRHGYGCEACWKEYLKVLDATNTENAKRQTLNEGRKRLQVLLGELYDEEQGKAKPIIEVAPTCERHPSMKGFCACVNAKRLKPKEVAPTRIYDETMGKEQPMLTAFLDCETMVKAIELPERDRTTWHEFAEQRTLSATE